MLYVWHPTLGGRISEDSKVIGFTELKQGGECIELVPISEIKEVGLIGHYSIGLDMKVVLYLTGYSCSLISLNVISLLNNLMLPRTTLKVVKILLYLLQMKKLLSFNQLRNRNQANIVSTVFQNYC